MLKTGERLERKAHRKDQTPRRPKMKRACCCLIIQQAAWFVGSGKRKDKTLTVVAGVASNTFQRLSSVSRFSETWKWLKLFPSVHHHRLAQPTDLAIRGLYSLDYIPDFFMCADDDTTDKDVFRALNESTLVKETVFSCTVGPSSIPNVAKCYQLEPSDILLAP